MKGKQWELELGSLDDLRQKSSSKVHFFPSLNSVSLNNLSHTHLAGFALLQQGTVAWSRGWRSGTNASTFSDISFLLQFQHLAIKVSKLLCYYMKYTDSSWSTQQKSFYIDELLTATKNEPLIETHVRTWTSPREDEAITRQSVF